MDLQIKVGTVGAKECGDYEEWFNYRVARAAPESCADFMGSFVADKTKSEFIKGGKWLVWKFEVCFFINTAKDRSCYIFFAVSAHKALRAVPPTQPRACRRHNPHVQQRRCATPGLFLPTHGLLK